MVRLTLHSTIAPPCSTAGGEQARAGEFGSDGTIIDCPQENAQVLLAAEYVRKTEQYEPRARGVRVGWTAGKFRLLARGLPVILGVQLTELFFRLLQSHAFLMKAFCAMEYQTMQYADAKGRMEMLKTSTGDALDALARAKGFHQQVQRVGFADLRLLARGLPVILGVQLTELFFRLPLAALVGLTRKEANRATATVRFTLSEAQNGATAIPTGTGVNQYLDAAGQNAVAIRSGLLRLHHHVGVGLSHRYLAVFHGVPA